MKLTPQQYETLPWLHIHGQYQWHAEAMIFGTMEALIALREAIDRAIVDKNGEAETEAFAGDGEGYGIKIRRVPRRAVQDQQVPYTADYARPRYDP